MELLKKLSEVNGISGHERQVKELVLDEIKDFVKKEEISYDNLGSVIVKKGNKGPKIMLAGHMDEVGMIVTKITDDGYLKFQTIGGWWSQVMLAQQMTITTSDKKTYLGVTGSKPPHILTPEERKNPVKIEDIYIDLGVTSKDEVEKMGIKIGDMITPKIDFAILNNNDFLLGKAWDDRIGVAIVIEVLRLLKDEELNNTVYGVFTVQEELGLRGAKTSSNIVNPDISIALDVGIAKDTPGTDGSVKMGKGPLILLYDGGLVGHTPLREFIVEVARKNDIAVQIDYLTGGATDAGAMHLAHDGSPAISLCIASRYIHSHTSMISKIDFENTVKLVVATIKALNQETVNEITYN
ncbi:MAG: M42 family metallopeptidase [Bacilli bacterium]